MNDQSTTPEQREEMIKNRGERLSALESQVNMKRGEQAALTYALVVIAAMFAITVVGIVLVLMRTEDDANAIVTAFLSGAGVVSSIASFIAGRLTGKDVKTSTT